MIVIRGELMLALAVVINSMGVVLLLHSGSGISAISSVPFSLNRIMPFLSLGTWTYIFQAFLIILLFMMRRKIVLSYLLSFVVGFFFGIMTDLHTLWIYELPLNIPLRILYFCIGYIVIAFGIALSNRCRMPLIPTDLFPREAAVITHSEYSKVKILFDVICLLITSILTLSFTGRIQGLGIGTVIAALTTGYAVDIVGKRIDRHYAFTSVFSEMDERKKAIKAHAV